MLMESVKVHLIKLKILLHYRLFFAFTLIHILIAFVYVTNTANQEYYSGEVYIEYVLEEDYYKYYTNHLIFTSVDEYSVGDKVYVEGECLDLKQTNFLVFSYDKYLMSEGYKCYLSNPKVDNVKGKNYIYVLKDKLKNFISKNDVMGMKVQLILGFDELSLDDKNPFYKNHVSHLIALSGMHIALLFLLVGQLLKKIFRVYEYQQVGLLIVLLVYWLLVYNSYSINRAALFLTLITLRNIFRWNISTINIYLIVINILLINPFAITSASFIYSSVCHLVILLIYNKRNFIHTYLHIVFAIIPINIYFSNEINIVGIFLSPILTIIFEVIYFPYIIITAFTSIPDSITVVMVETLRDLPSFVVYIKSLGLINIITYYYIYYIVVTKKMTRKLMYIVVSFILMINLTPEMLHSTHFIGIIDVGQGDATLFILSDGTTILLDTGGIIYDEERNYELYYYTIKPYLKSKGINRIDYLILSHGDYDHIGTAKYVIQDFKISNTITNCNEINSTEKELLATPVRNLNITGYNYSIELSCLKSKNENDSSLVLYANLNGYKYLSLGDIEENEMQFAFAADILKVSHHGSSSSTSRDFVEKIDAEYGIISVGRNSYGHPSSEVLENLFDVEVYRTDVDGGIEIYITNEISIYYKNSDGR